MKISKTKTGTRPMLLNLWVIYQSWVSLEQLRQEHFNSRGLQRLHPHCFNYLAPCHHHLSHHHNSHHCNSIQCHRHRHPKHDHQPQFTKMAPKKSLQLLCPLLYQASPSFPSFSSLSAFLPNHIARNLRWLLCR